MIIFTNGKELYDNYLQAWVNFTKLTKHRLLADIKHLIARMNLKALRYITARQASSFIFCKMTIDGCIIHLNELFKTSNRLVLIAVDNGWVLGCTIIINQQTCVMLNF